MAVSIYERFGRLQEKYESEYEQHLQTIDVLGKLKRGEIDLSQIEVTDTSWIVVPKPEKPPE